jgi:universal stress protein A
MDNYKHILLAVDFFEPYDTVVNRARDLANRYQAKLSIIHVADDLPIIDTDCGVDIPFEIELTNELIEKTKIKLKELGNELAVTEDCQWLEIGTPRAEIIRVATENQVDLIVTGSHGRHGLAALMLGSTADDIVHYAPCDVLAVHLHKK